MTQVALDPALPEKTSALFPFSNVVPVIALVPKVSVFPRPDLSLQDVTDDPVIVSVLVSAASSQS
jgi:hypothetical protein